MTILLVDDDTSNLCLVKHILVREGMQVQCAASGKEALVKLEASSFNLMITDLNMPGMDGFVLTRQATVIAPQMPVIISTGDISPEVLNKAREAGIVSVLGKPFFAEELLDVVRQAAKDRCCIKMTDFFEGDMAKQ